MGGLDKMAESFAEGAGKESVNQISELIKTLFPAFGLKREALKTYIEDIQKSNLPAETKMFLISNSNKTLKHMQNQHNIAQIALDSINNKEQLNVKNVNTEFIDRFMDSAKFVSDDDLQLMWGKILSGELEKPYSTPPNAIRILSELTAPYAEIFQAICNMKILIVYEDSNGNLESEIEERVIISANSKENFPLKHNINTSTLMDLESLGLIKYESPGEYTRKMSFQKIHLYYHSDIKTILNYEEFWMGNIALTKAGKTIMKFVEDKKIEGYFDYLEKYMKKNGCEFSEKPQIKMTKISDNEYRIEKMR